MKAQQEASTPAKTVIIIAGPTAVGKTAIAIKLAKEFQTEIISADSRQCYKELRIGVARPSTQELEEVPHHFIATHSIQEEVSAADFEKYALQKSTELFSRHDTIIMSGGTGLYIKAFCDGLDTIPTVDPAIRRHIRMQYDRGGQEWLQEEIGKKDPLYFEKGEILNPQRMMRALEVVESTGKSILAFRRGKKTKRDFNILRIALNLPKEELHRNIYARVDKMLADGLVEEVNALRAFRHLNALKTVGYTDIFQYLDGEITLAKAAELIKINTRQYAKRQLTWFKKDPEMQWFSPYEYESIVKVIKERLVLPHSTQ